MHIYWDSLNTARETMWEKGGRDVLVLIYVAVAFVKLFAGSEITKRTISVSPTNRKAGQLPEAPTYEEHYDVTGITGNMAPVNLGFHKQKNLSENDLQFGHVTSKVLVNSVLGQKCLLSILVLRSAKLLACMAHQVTGLPGAVAYQGGGGVFEVFKPPPPKFRRYRWSPRSHEQEEPASRFSFDVHCVLLRL